MPHILQQRQQCDVVRRRHSTHTTVATQPTHTAVATPAVRLSRGESEWLHCSLPVQSTGSIQGLC